MSGSSTELKAVFTAEDRTTSVLRGIAASLRGLTGASGLGRFAAASQQLVSGLAGMASTATLAAASVAGLGGAASAAGLGNLAVSTAATAASLRGLAESSRVPLERLEGLVDIARRANISQDDLAGGLGTLNQRLRDAGRGGSVELRDVMRALHINLRDTSGQVRNAADVLPQFAQAFSRIRDPALRAELATALFGEAGARLLPMLVNGSAGLAEGEKRFRMFGVSLAGSSAELAKANAQFNLLRDSMTGLGTMVSSAIGASLAPILGPIAAGMARWVQENKKWIATNIATYVRDTAIAIRDFFRSTENLARLRQFALSVRNAFNAIGGLRGLMIGFSVIVVAPFAAAILSIVTNIGLVIGVIGRLSFVLLTTPFGWFLGIVAAIAGAAYLIYRNWDGIAAWFRGIWTRVVTAWTPQVAEMARLVTGLGRSLVGPLLAVWAPVAAFFEGVWDGITRVFTEAWARIEPIVRALREAGRLINGAGTGPEASSNPQMNQAAQDERSRRNGVQRISGFDNPGRPIWNGLSESGSSGLYVGPGARGAIEATIRFENAPPGTRVEATGTGLVQQPRTELGVNLGAGLR